ncbi:fibronectin-binding protein fibrinogen-binding protein [Ligilactobacillus apodemi DSM 16634 = JCM 16172]|uniref:Rqc2 homolog RqcH n=1 Tax=Ligilactobacillus apodemi DSM 16634 = JCM 16172 TaxID=1423724 RepID=A0A0R1TUF2_9LACO|nr:NFACT RNA binding domain-containing protein [Ligilactobacillus apodemi]KRL83876.1 fibronectin-binding protein fibrinogen-binding protein [Ligilactobacillus apodemi DSM 16634 = JCM 16172]
MAFDGIFTRAMTNELNELLLDGRVMKISQPYPNEVILTIRKNRHNYPLLLSAHANYARVQITNIPYTNPPVPTNFTMVLRKYLEGAKLVATEQLGCDRVLYLSFVTRNELGDRLPLKLSIEIMGRYSNIILIDQATNKILDTVKHVGMDQNRYRTLLPGASYRTPPAQDKRDPFNDPEKKYLELVQMYPNKDVLATQLMRTYQGLSRQSALVLASFLHQDQAETASFAEFLAQTKQPTPTIFEIEKKLAFGIFAQPKTVATFTTLSELLDNYYQEKAEHDRVSHQGAKLIHVVKKELAKNKTKLSRLEKDLQTTKKADGYRIKGELLTTYLYQLKPGDTTVTLPNYYDEERPVEITLSPQLSPAQNAQKYFKKYQKLKNAIAHINEQLRLTKAELDYLESVQTQLELAAPSDLTDIALELRSEGYLKETQKNKKRKPKLSKPEHFLASDGTEISVGKNNLQNDRLTLKTANKNDYWLHVKDIPGSHVIVHSNEPTEETLLEAANLAAYYSKARASANVPVDYVQVRHIRKPNGAKPGYVIYEGQKTLYVTPDKTLVEKMHQ